MTKTNKIQEILQGDDKRAIRALFSFDKQTSNEAIELKFNLWARYFFAKYYTSKDAPFHKQIDRYNIEAYRGQIDSFTDIAFRGAGKDARTKLFIGFALLNDLDHSRRYIKVLTADSTNSTQITTDLYNILVNQRVAELYPETFEKTNQKREERMSSFTTSTGVKVIADTVGTDQRGSIQEDARPDLLWCHKKGTLINDGGDWIPVEKHPSFNKYREEIGYTIKLYSLYKTETVTREHRYWTPTGWKMAKDIVKGDYIGHKIDDKQRPIKKLVKYKGGIINRGNGGKIINTRANYSKEFCSLLNNEDWWWLIGLFWGDGNLSSKKDTGNNSSTVCLTISDKDNGIYSRVSRILNESRIKHSVHRYNSCFRVQFSCAILARFLRGWYLGGNSQKCPPEWVEHINKKYIKQLILGYIDADGYVEYKKSSVRIASVSYLGLLSLRRMLARLGISSSIRLTAKKKDKVFVIDRYCSTQERYDLRFRDNASKLGFEIKNQTRYSKTEVYIDGGFLWSKVQSVTMDKKNSRFCPIQTKSHTYHTAFGLSHNCNDFETRKTLRSAVTTKAIWDNMEEARTGLSIDGSFIATCNYISEMGNVHTLVLKRNDKNIVLIVPIIDDKGVIAWPDRYTKEDIEQMRLVDDDFEGEKLCRPSASKDILFDREALEKMKVKEPIKEIAGLKIYHEYDPSHRYGSGHDVAGGVGLDSSTSVFIDFDTVPARVVATFANNTIKPDVFGDEINREGEYFGMPIAGIEKNNHGHATIARARQLGVNLYRTQSKDTRINESQSTEYGWHTNTLTKPKAIFDLVKACNDGLLELSDYGIIRECMSYTRNDVMDKEIDPRLTTRHSDLLMATAIAWQMRNHADTNTNYDWVVEDVKTHSAIGL